MRRYHSGKTSLTLPKNILYFNFHDFFSRWKNSARAEQNESQTIAKSDEIDVLIRVETLKFLINIAYLNEFFISRLYEFYQMINPNQYLIHISEGFC